VGQHRKSKTKQPGQLIILCAPSGAGKTTLARELLERHRNWVFSISATTRPPRAMEKDGRDYYFLTPAAFGAMRKNREFVEWAKVHTDFYGTPKEPLERVIAEGKSVILDIDVQGERQVKRLYPEAVSIFILAPSWQELKARLVGRRTENRQSFEKRLESARKELKALSRFDFIVTNEKVERSVETIETIVAAAKYRTVFVQHTGGCSSWKTLT